MGKRWKKPIVLLAVAMTLGLIIWITSARRAEAEEQARQVSALEAAVASLEEDQLEQHRNLAKWYNHQLELDAAGLEACYGSILNLGDGRMGVLELPERSLRRAIYHGETGAVGHDPASSLPIGGRGTHTVLLLRERYPWAAGQTVYIDILGQRLTYRVESVQVMSAGWCVARSTEAGQELLTFVYDRGNTRTIVRCVRCADLTVRPLDEPKPGCGLPAALAIPVMLIVRRCCGKCARREHTPRICGFYRENRDKSKLS